MNGMILTFALAWTSPCGNPCESTTCTPVTATLPRVSVADELGSNSFNCDWVKVFDHSCSFPLPRFDRAENRLNEEGLVIYEGMKLAVCNKTGNYQLSFTATTPDINVVLRLKFEIYLNGTLQTITIPPIKIVPLDANYGMGTTVNIVHNGYSPAFHKGLNECNPLKIVMKDNCKEITRAGTARFGTPIAVEDSYYK